MNAGNDREEREGEGEEDGDAAAEGDGGAVDLAVAGVVDEPETRRDAAHGQGAEPREGEAEGGEGEDGEDHAGVPGCCAVYRGVSACLPGGGAARPERSRFSRGYHGSEERVGAGGVGYWEA